MPLNSGPWDVTFVDGNCGLTTTDTLFLTAGIVTVVGGSPSPWGTYNDTLMKAQRASPSMKGTLTYDSSTKQLHCELDGLTGASWTAVEGGSGIGKPPKPRKHPPKPRTL